MASLLLFEVAPVALIDALVVEGWCFDHQLPCVCHPSANRHHQSHAGQPAPAESRGGLRSPNGEGQARLLETLGTFFPDSDQPTWHRGRLLPPLRRTYSCVSLDALNSIQHKKNAKSGARGEGGTETDPGFGGSNSRCLGSLGVLLGLEERGLEVYLEHTRAPRLSVQDQAHIMRQPPAAPCLGTRARKDEGRGRYHGTAADTIDFASLLWVHYA